MTVFRDDLPVQTRLPKVWLLLGRKNGEVAQQRELAQRLGLPFEEKYIVRSAWYFLPNRLLSWFRPRVDAGRGTTLEGDWPDLAISFGRSMIPAALWLRRQSGGRTRIVHMGRPRGVPVNGFDQLIPMPPDRVPDAPNVIRLSMPLNRQDPVKMALMAPRLAPRLAMLPRPFTLLVIGGNSRHCRLDIAQARAIAERANAHTQARRGSLLVVTSPRTPADIVTMLHLALKEPGLFYEYRRDETENLLPGFMAVAQDFIVTADSASMISEAWRTGKPVYVAALEPRQDLRERIAETLRRLLPAPLVRKLQLSGLLASKVDQARWVRQLVADGRVGLLGGQAPIRPYDQSNDAELQDGLRRIAELLTPRP